MSRDVSHDLAKLCGLAGAVAVAVAVAWVPLAGVGVAVGMHLGRRPRHRGRLWARNGDRPDPDRPARIQRRPRHPCAAGDSRVSAVRGGESVTLLPCRACGAEIVDGADTTAAIQGDFEFGGEQVDLTERDTDELEQMNSFLSRNIDAEVDAQRAKGGFGTSDFAQEYSEKQTEVALELDRRD